MTKQLFELLTIDRLRESKILLDNGCFNGAYYLAGYTIEFGLKAIILKQVNAHEMPSKAFVLEFYVHNLSKLISLANIERDLNVKLRTDRDFAANWGTVKDWNEGARYKIWTDVQAKELYNAIESLKGGILPWIQQYW